jgi:hypothetical protein
MNITLFIMLVIICAKTVLVKGLTEKKQILEDHLDLGLRFKRRFSVRSTCTTTPS